jgi:hypothetical protein
MTRSFSLYDLKMYNIVEKPEIMKKRYRFEMEYKYNVEKNGTTICFGCLHKMMVIIIMMMLMSIHINTNSH